MQHDGDYQSPRHEFTGPSQMTRRRAVLLGATINAEQFSTWQGWPGVRVYRQREPTVNIVLQLPRSLLDLSAQNWEPGHVIDHF